MKTHWIWIFGILTVAGTVVAVVTSLATPGRDTLSFAIGVVVGATAAACISAVLIARAATSSAVESDRDLSRAEKIVKVSKQLRDLDAQRIYAFGERRKFYLMAQEAQARSVMSESIDAKSKAQQYEAHVAGLNVEIDTTKADLAGLQRMTDKEWRKARKQRAS